MVPTQAELDKISQNITKAYESQFNSSFAPRVNSGATNCCGLYLGLTEKPIAIEIDISEVPLKKVSDDERVVFDSFLLTSGKYLNMQFFVPQDYNDMNGYEATSQVEYNPKEGVGAVALNHLSGYKSIFDKGTATQYFGSRIVNVPLLKKWDDLIKQLSGKQFFCVEKESSSYTLRDVGLLDYVDIQYESPRFHSRSYPENDLNYLQLKIFTVK